MHDLYVLPLDRIHNRPGEWGVFEDSRLVSIHPKESEAFVFWEKLHIQQKEARDAFNSSACRLRLVDLSGRPSDRLQGVPDKKRIFWKFGRLNSSRTTE